VVISGRWLVVSALLAAFAAIACSGSGSSDDTPLDEVEGTEVYDRLVEAVTGSNQVFEVDGTTSFEPGEFRIWVAPGGDAGRAEAYVDGSFSGVSVYADRMVHSAGSAISSSTEIQQVGDLDQWGIYTLVYLIRMSSFDELSVVETEVDGVELFEVVGEIAGADPETGRQCRATDTLLVERSSSFPIRFVSAASCEGESIQETVFSYRDAALVDQDDLEDRWFQEEGLADYVLRTRLDEAKALGFPIYTVGTERGLEMKMQLAEVLSETSLGKFPQVNTCFEPGEEPPTPIDEWPTCVVRVSQFAVEHFEPRVCSSLNVRTTIELENGNTAVLCSGASRLLEFEGEETAFAIITSGVGQSVAGASAAFNTDEGIVEIANSLVPAP